MITIDLEQRKEGDVLGRSQSGGKSHLRLLRVLRDESLIDQAREVAVAILKTDPDLSNLPELNNEVEKLKSDEAARFMDKNKGIKIKIFLILSHRRPVVVTDN